jgi:hypothetical protein
MPRGILGRLLRLVAWQSGRCVLPVETVELMNNAICVGFVDRGPCGFKGILYEAQNRDFVFSLLKRK